jgi:hypothetical protein
MITEKTRRELIDAGWKPPAVTDYDIWRPALAAYWEQRGYPGAGQRILKGAPLDLSDKETINGMAAARSFMPPE